MLEDIVLSDSLRYEQHTLIYGADDPIRIEGALGAALLCALLVDTEEGNRRKLARYTKRVLAQETDIAFLQNETDSLTNDDQKTFGQWIEKWNSFITRRLKPQREIRFWVNGVPQKTQTHLIEYLRLQEQTEYHYKRLASAYPIFYVKRCKRLVYSVCGERGIRTPGTLTSTTV